MDAIANTMVPTILSLSPISSVFNLVLNVPVVNLSLLDFEILLRLRQKSDNAIHIQKMKRVPATLSQFRKLKELLSKKPFAAMKRLDESRPLYEGELVSIPIERWGVYLLFFYICTTYEYVPDERVRFGFANYESELFMSYTDLDIGYANGEVEIEVDKKGYVHAYNYGLLLRFIFDDEFFRERFDDNIDETIQNIISLVDNV